MFATLMIIVLTCGACSRAPEFTAPNNVSIPVRDYVHIGDQISECSAKRVNQLRWRTDKSLEICSTSGWLPIRVEGDASELQ